MENTQKEKTDKDNLNLTVMTVLGAFVIGTIFLVVSSVLGVESFKIKDCLVQDKSIKGCELERHSGIPNGVKIALDVLGSSLITSSITIAFLELGLRNSNKNLLIEIIRNRHVTTISSIDDNFSKRMKDANEVTKEIIRAELITTKDIHEFYPSYIEYVSKICRVFEQDFDSQYNRSEIDIIEIGDKLLPNINHDLCSKILCGWKVRLIVVNRNDQTEQKITALRSLLEERMKKTTSPLKKVNFGSLEIAFLLDGSIQYFDYFRLNGIPRDSRQKELMFMCFHEPDINTSLPGLSIANPLVKKRFETYFDSRWNENRVDVIVKIDENNFDLLKSDTNESSKSVVFRNSSSEAKTSPSILDSDKII